VKNFIAYKLALEAADALRPVLAAIARHDCELERQTRRAMSSVVLNIPEGNRRSGCDRLQHFRIAATHGQLRWPRVPGAAEAQAGVDLSRIWGYVSAEQAAPAAQGLDRLGAVLYRLTERRR
jgi:four helix bundle protein